MADNAPPSRNPAVDGTMQGAIFFVLSKFLASVDDCLPAKVIAFDRQKNVAQVQPLISVVTTLNQIISRAQIATVPVLRIGGGGMFASYNLLPGNMGWIKACDRDISLFLQTFTESIPNTKRKHNFADCVFIPDAMTEVTIMAEDVNNAVWSTNDASTRIALWNNKVKVTAPQMAIGDTEGYTPNPNAILDLQSTTKAFQVPRMAGAQRDAIPSPTGGMMVYVTDGTPHLSVYTDGSGWS